MAETSKARKRREAEGFFEKYINGKSVIDIGVGRLDTHDGSDPICEHAEMHDKDICDATTMGAYRNKQFDTVYASHILEHISDPITAVAHWLRICKKGGHLIISCPHRDLYEKKTTLPSRWNDDHKFFILPYRSEPPCTFSLADILQQAVELAYKQNGVEIEVVSFETIDTCSEANKENRFEHADGEFSIEVIIKRI